jgi:hypothetical protein
VEVVMILYQKRKYNTKVIAKKFDSAVYFN